MSIQFSVHRGLLFGVVADKPALPAGFSYIEAPGEWLLATNGKKTYFVGRDRLTLRRHVRRRDVRRTYGRLKLGRHFLDEKHTIKLSNP